MDKKHSKNNKKKDQVIRKKRQNNIPDSWDIVKKKDSVFLLFYCKNKTIAKIEILPEIINDLMVELNQHIIVDSNLADSWTFRKPLEEEAPDFLTIMNKGKILGTLPIDSDTGKKLSKQLIKYTNKITIKEKLNTLRKTKPKTFYLTSFLTVLVISIIIYSIVTNILYNFGIILPTI